MATKKIKEMTPQEWLNEIKEVSKKYKEEDSEAMTIYNSMLKHDNEADNEELTDLVLSAHVKIELLLRMTKLFANALQSSHKETLKLIADLDAALKSKNFEQTMKMIEDIRMEIAKRNDKEQLIEFVAEGLETLLNARGISLQQLMNDRNQAQKDQPYRNNRKWNTTYNRETSLQSSISRHWL